jgi:hypothetical protein
LIAVGAGSLSLIGGGSITTDTTGGSGNAGGVSLNIAGAVTLDGTSAPLATTGIFSQANLGSSGNAGTIGLDAGSLSISAGRISSTTLSNRSTPAGASAC